MAVPLGEDASGGKEGYRPLGPRPGEAASPGTPEADANAFAPEADAQGGTIIKEGSGMRKKGFA